MEIYKIAIIILVALNGILVYVISRLGSHARECDSSNSERFSKLRKLCEHEAKAVDLYSTEVRRYAESENEFLNNLLEILKKNEKYYNYWVNFKPFENPKDAPQRLANSIHFATIERPEESIYTKGMKTQQLQFEALEKAILRFISNLSEKEQNKIIKKINTRKAKINF